MAKNFIVSGDDAYLRGKEEKKIRDKFLTADEINLNSSVYSPEDYRKAIDDLGTAPFLAEKRVVVLRDAEELSEEALGAVKAYLKKPFPHSVFVITAGSEFRKNPAYREITASASPVLADPLTPYKIKDGIRSFFKKENIDISSEAVDLIFELKGSDPALIINELEKLASFSGGEKIELSHVEELVGRSVTETVYKLVDAINSGDRKHLFRVLDDLAGQKKQAPEIIGYLGWYIRVVQKIKFLSMKGAGRDEIISSAGGGAYRILPKAEKFTSLDVKKWLDAVLEADVDVKRGRKEPFLALETLLVKLSGK